MTSIGEIMPDVVKRLTVLSEEAMAHRKKLDQDLAHCEHSIRCHHHKDVVRPLDLNATSMATWHNKRLSLVYADCPKCRDANKFAWAAALGVPQKFIGCTFENYIIETDEDDANVDAVQAFAADPVGALIMLGNTGRGKTHLACAILQHLRKGRYFSHSQLLEDYAGKRYSGGSELVKQAKAASILVLDEVGASRGGPDDQALLHSIIAARYDAWKPTVICSNIPKAEFAKFIGDRAADRLREKCAVLIFTGESRRRKYGEGAGPAIAGKVHGRKPQPDTGA